MVIPNGKTAPDGSDYLTVVPNYLLPIHTKAIQELNAKHKKEMAKQKELNQEKDSEIDALVEVTEKLKTENEMLKDYLCDKDPEAPFCGE